MATLINHKFIDREDLYGLSPDGVRKIPEPEQEEEVDRFIVADIYSYTLLARCVICRPLGPRQGVELVEGTLGLAVLKPRMKLKEVTAIRIKFSICNMHIMDFVGDPFDPGDM
jgi:hypothetical protein